MADEIDRAQERSEQFLAHSLHERAMAPTLPPPTGLCFNCQESLPMGERYCNKECRDDWQRRMQARQRN